jgi:hypothetical protein
MRMGVPLRDYLLPKKFDAGIEISRVIQGTVPEFECREAAVYVHVSWDTWSHDMDGWARACAVAHYRTSLSLKAHVEDAAERAVKRKSNRAARRRSRSGSSD